MKRQIDMLVLALIASGACGCNEPRPISCDQNLEQTLAVRGAVRKIDERLEHFTIQPECAVCPKTRTCPDDSEALSKGDEASREMEELRAILKRYKNDSNYNYGQLTEDLENLAGD